MTDHMTTEERLAAAERAEQPSWIADLIAFVAAGLAIALVLALGQVTALRAELEVATSERDLWRQLASAPDMRTTVRVEPEGSGFRCSHMNVRPEWELAVAAECQVLGALLQMAARPAP